jgi:hypothetical protein
MSGFKGLVLILLSSLLIGVNACGLAKTLGDPAELGYTLYYLTDSKIYKVVLPAHDKTDLIYDPEGQHGESLNFNALNRGPGRTLMFHMVRTTDVSASSPAFAKTKMTISTYDIRTGKLETLADVADTFLSFPVLSTDESKVAMAGSDSFFIKDLKRNRMIYYSQFANPNRRLFPWSWSPDNKLALSGGEPGKKPAIYFFDTERHALVPWGIGLQPHFSPSGQLIAYLHPEHRALIISDRNGNTVQSFEGFLFKDLNGWIGEDKVLFTIACGTHTDPYKNHIGIADLTTRKIYDISVPTDGQISGVVVAKEGLP